MSIPYETIWVRIFANHETYYHQKSDGHIKGRGYYYCYIAILFKNLPSIMKNKRAPKYSNYQSSDTYKKLSDDYAKHCSILACKQIGCICNRQSIQKYNRKIPIPWEYSIVQLIEETFPSLNENGKRLFQTLKEAYTQSYLKILRMKRYKIDLILCWAQPLFSYIYKKRTSETLIKL